MDAQLHRPTTLDQHPYEEDPHLNVANKHSVMEGEGEAEHNHHGEKKSVLKKVKDKAKKIKDKITHGGHPHDDEDYDDEVEETVIASHVHAAPVSEDAFISGTNLPKQTGLNLENPINPLEDLQNPNVIANAGMADRHGPHTRNAMHSSIGHDPLSVTSSPMEEEPYNPSTMREQVYYGVGEVGSGLGKMGRFQMDAPYTDPFDPLPTSTATLDSVPRANVAEPAVKIGPLTDLKDPHAGSGLGKTGRLHMDTPYADPFDPLPTSTATLDSQTRANVAEPVAKIGPLTDLEKDPHAPGAISPPNYQAKVVDPTGKGGAEAEVAPLVERLGNLHVGDKTEERSYTGSHDQFAPISEPFDPEMEPKSFDADRPESMPQDTVAGKISAATSVIADKASSAKNAVASKLGYGQAGQEPSRATAMESVSEYGHMVAEKLAPVYGKAAGAGSAIMSKVQGGDGEGVAAKEGDKGVSVQGYLAEKFSPGDEDKELSKVITDAIHRKKERAPGAVEDEAVPVPVKETIRIEAVASNEKAAAGVVDRVKDAIGSWLGKSQGEEGLEKEEVGRVGETGK